MISMHSLIRNTGANAPRTLLVGGIAAGLILVCLLSVGNAGSATPTESPIGTQQPHAITGSSAPGRPDQATQWSYSAATLDNPVLGVPISGTQSLSYEALGKLVQRIHSAYSSLPQRQFDTSDAAYRQFAAEALPYFQREGIVTKVVQPAELDWGTWTDADYLNVTGEARCLSGSVTMSARYKNPYSAWYGRVSFYSTLVHELAHVQGICMDDSAKVEGSAQVVSLEVLAAMALDGNEVAMYAFLEELQSEAFGTMQYVAMTSNRFDEYRRFRSDLMSSAVDDAARSRFVRQYEGKAEEWQSLLGEYSEKPFDWIVEGARTGHATGVLLPANCVRYLGMSPQGPVFSQASTRPLDMDDIDYLLQNMEKLTSDIASRAKSSH